MSCKASDVLLVAERLLASAENESDHKSRVCEALCRSAISRAYYCLFHVCKDWAVDRGFKKPRFIIEDGVKRAISEHEWVQRWYFVDPDTQLLATKLTTAFDRRISADYHLGTWECTPARAKDIIDDIKEAAKHLAADKDRVTALGPSNLKRTITWN